VGLPTPRPSDLRFRRAREADLDRVVEIHLSAYTDARGAAARRRYFTNNAFGRLADLVVAEQGGELVALAFLYPFHAAFGGAWVKASGIGSVAVAPEARGAGVATALVEHLHRLSARRGDAVTMLHAFRYGFYARLGYATTSSRKRLAIDPRAVPAAWRALARGRISTPGRGDDRVLYRLHERAAERASGWIRRSRRRWESLLLREARTTLLYRDARGTPAGYVAFALVQEESYGPTILEVEELVAVDAEARRALLGALAAMRDQVAEILVEIADGDPLELALIDADGHRRGTDAIEHPLGDVVGGPMVRLTEVPRAVTARGYAAGRVSFEIVLRDARAEPIDVRIEDGRASIEARGRRRPPLVTTRAGLAAVLYGGLAVADAVALGIAEADRHLARALDALVAIPPLTPIEPF
jgi:predicted acetyltransferase